MRNLVGQNGVSVSLHADSDGAIIEGSGASGIDPASMTLVNNEIGHLTPTTMTSLLAESIGVGSACIACLGNLTVGIGGLGTLYANAGLEATTATITGIATVGALTVNQDITCTGVLNLTTTGLAKHI